MSMFVMSMLVMSMLPGVSSLLKNVIEAADARQKRVTDSPGANQDSAG
jgi:hypothetical protein